MILRRHPDARCPTCGSREVWWGLKSEATGWKVLRECDDDECDYQGTAGWIPMSEVDSVDEALRKGEERIA